MHIASILSAWALWEYQSAWKRTRDKALMAPRAVVDGGTGWIGLSIIQRAKRAYVVKAALASASVALSNCRSSGVATRTAPAKMLKNSTKTVRLGSSPSSIPLYVSSNSSFVDGIWKTPNVG